MDEQGSGSATTGDCPSAGAYAPGKRRDGRHSRTEWQRQQYRVAEPEAIYDNETPPHESNAEDA